MLKSILFSFMVTLCWTTTECAAQLKVVFFLSPNCTICQFYSLEMRQLSEDYRESEIEFVGYAVGPLLTDSIVDAYRRVYKIPFPVWPDDSMHWVLNATVTPEVFVIQNDVVQYHGRIDDSFVRVGRRRAQVKNKELRSAVESILHGVLVETKYAAPVGCIIEKNKP